jgi:hypothetical protein
MRIVRETLIPTLGDRDRTPRTVATYPDRITTDTAHQFMVQLAQVDAGKRGSPTFAYRVESSTDSLSGRSVAYVVHPNGDKMVLFRQVWRGQPKPVPVEYRTLPSSVNDMKPEEVRNNLPYKPGDVIFIEGSGGKPRIALVQYAGTKYVERMGYWLEKYRVAIMRPDGSFHPRGRHTTYPGPIQRGYKQAGKISGVD